MCGASCSRRRPSRSTGMFINIGSTVCSGHIIKRGDDENSQVSATTSTGYLGSTRCMRICFALRSFSMLMELARLWSLFIEGARRSPHNQHHACPRPVDAVMVAAQDGLSRKSAFSTSRHCLASRLSATFRSDISRLSFHQILSLSRMGNLPPLLNTCRTSLGKMTNL